MMRTGLSARAAPVLFRRRCLNATTIASVQNSKSSLPLIRPRANNNHSIVQLWSYNRQCFSSDNSVPELPSNSTPAITRILAGPLTQFGSGRLATRTAASVLGVAGDTTVLTTLAISHSTLSHSHDPNEFTTDVSFRWHAVGRVPPSKTRRDHAGLSPAEVVASRAVDRALRPLRKSTHLSRRHVAFSVQTYGSVESLQEPLYNNVEQEEIIPDSNSVTASTSGHPVALAINTAAVALTDHLTEHVAAVVLSILPDGTILLDPPPSFATRHGWLLYAGTRERVVMMEYAAGTDAAAAKRTGRPLDQWPELLAAAHAAIQPLLDAMGTIQVTLNNNTIEPDADEVDAIRQSLGLPALSAPEVPPAPSVVDTKQQDDIRKGAVKYCKRRLRDALLIYYGAVSSSPPDANDVVLHSARVHRHGPLFTEEERAKQKSVLVAEIKQNVDTYLDCRKQTLLGDKNVNLEDIQPLLQYLDSPEPVYSHVMEVLFSDAFTEACLEHGVRADRRGGDNDEGWKTIRPIQLIVPALNQHVHGSALFARGNTKVLCTVTLGLPHDGLSVTNPLQPNPRDGSTNRRWKLESSSAPALPIGSLRSLQTPESLSLHSSRKTRAEKELIGDSGTFANVQRAFLQYDFPSYATGNVPTGNPAHNRRAIGHGALAERAILPVLPPIHTFPYTIRMTSEVTDSSGSSSMATVCGVTLALLDAGVPLRRPVVGVSVGLVAAKENPKLYRLLLDITGSEDRNGLMDFKIAGTHDNVTAFQLDVKTPVSISVLVEALELAQSGRRVILHEMQDQALRLSLGGLRARHELKASAPRVAIVRFDPLRKWDLIGPNGMIRRQLEDSYDVTLDLTQEGHCLIYGSCPELVAKANDAVMDLVADVVKGQVYTGTVMDVKDYGVVVELLRNKEGILHVNEMAVDGDPRSHPDGLLGYVRSRYQIGDEIKVLVLDVDPLHGVVKLSSKGLHKKQKSFNNTLTQQNG